MKSFFFFFNIVLMWKIVRVSDASVIYIYIKREREREKEREREREREREITWLTYTNTLEV